MGKIKGCGNESCETHNKKITCKESEAFCSKCGSQLVYVCKDCYTQLPNDSEKYCVRCFAKREDRKHKAKKVAAGVGGGALAIGGVILTFGKKALDVAKKIKG
ncbi:hypothetical protein VT91_08440 [Clostridium sporogenes]|uniref:hypothetical protein n=1 Tax=Clostridium botulinum TaxID=1491 RepID=UPI0007177C40|nr:hypothetical protein [Clostridium botulinum]KRU25041.1 hypothetical protein VT28_35290 [Clostridium sporogenes]KRU31932.1 hypothetical protein WG71_04400 [Clostridium sporogenes]KRU34202.1 hypothetical protein VT91_08440 [Clostridium sporogenes]KRU41219.1 hypothetical protein VT95_24460 [Clostridium sporogenes]MBZ1328195.1 hypothetical protein [Clostridium botulinum]